jgi:predicted 2-oxoglutarate/Fe(II)-dependent dioxygenase YbiX
MKWEELPRLETISNRLSTELINNNVTVTNIAFGMNLYKNAIKKDECLKIVNSLELELSSGIPEIFWHTGKVNDGEELEQVRHCTTLVYKKEDLGKSIPFSQVLYDVHDSIEKSLDNCLDHYGTKWHLKTDYKESLHLIKYLPGNFFKLHADSGPYYPSTISAIFFLNDDYEGGELYFPRQDLTIKPSAGDILLFPSIFIYEHAVLNVLSGIKYSGVILNDYVGNHKEDIENV